MNEANNAKSGEKIRVMFVCLGNICRSPVAEAVFKDEVRRAGLDERFHVASSGTGSWHVGEPADRRMRETAERNGLAMDAHRGQQFATEHLTDYDYIFAMDRDNLQDILHLDPNDEFGHKVRLFREFDPEPESYQVPDPYYGGKSGFDNVYGIVRRTARNLLARLAEEHDLALEGDTRAT